MNRGFAVVLAALACAAGGAASARELPCPSLRPRHDERGLTTQTSGGRRGGNGRKLTLVRGVLTWVSRERPKLSWWDRQRARELAERRRREEREAARRERARRRELRLRFGWESTRARDCGTRI